MNARIRRPRPAAQHIVFGTLLAAALFFAPAALAVPGDPASSVPVPRHLRVVLGDDSEISGVGPARVEIGHVLFRLEDGLLVSLPFGRVKMIVPAWRRAIEEMAATAGPRVRSLPAAMKAVPAPAPAPPGSKAIVITNADLPTIHRLMYSSAPLERESEGAVTVRDESGGVPQFDEIYWRARARGVLDQLRQAIARVRRAAGHVSSLERFSSAMRDKGPLPAELMEEMATAQVELEAAENLRDELILEWEELKAVARDAGAELGSL